MTQPDLVSKLREALQAARRFVRGRHSTLTYGPQALLEQIDEAIALLGLASTPIVPSTPDDPRFDGVVVEVAEEFAILEEDIPALRQILARLRPAAGLSAEQVQAAIEPVITYIASKSQWQRIADRLNALLAAKPALMPVFIALHFDPEQKSWPRIAGVYSTYEAAEARVEELGSGATQSLQMDNPVKFTFERPAPAGEVRSGWEQGYDKAIREALEAGLPQLEWANIHGSRCEELLRWVKDLLRLSPAGEVRISRWQCPHCAHVNLMTSANCENCKIPLVNTAGEVKGEK